MSVNVRSAHFQGDDFVVITRYDDPTESAKARLAAEGVRVSYPIRGDARVEHGGSRHVPIERCYERVTRFVGAR